MKAIVASLFVFLFNLFILLVQADSVRESFGFENNWEVRVTKEAGAFVYTENINKIDHRFNPVFTLTIHCKDYLGVSISVIGEAFDHRQYDTLKVYFDDKSVYRVETIALGVDTLQFRLDLENYEVLRIPINLHFHKTLRGTTLANILPSNTDVRFNITGFKETYDSHCD